MITQQSYGRFSLCLPVFIVILSMANGLQLHHLRRVTRTTTTTAVCRSWLALSLSENDNHEIKSNKEEIEFDSLDVVLERARKRRPSNVTKLIAAMTQPSFIPWLARLDLLYALMAVGLGSKGFALGYIIGKASNGYIHEVFPQVSPRIKDIWPLLLAVCIDQAFF